MGTNQQFGGGKIIGRGRLPGTRSQGADAHLVGIGVGGSGDGRGISGGIGSGGIDGSGGSGGISGGNGFGVGGFWE
jgi:hypothetical protein